MAQGPEMLGQAVGGAETSEADQLEKGWGGRGGRNTVKVAWAVTLSKVEQWRLSLQAVKPCCPARLPGPSPGALHPGKVY